MNNYTHAANFDLNAVRISLGVSVAVALDQPPSVVAFFPPGSFQACASGPAGVGHAPCFSADYDPTQLLKGRQVISKPPMPPPSSSRLQPTVLAWSRSARYNSTTYPLRNQYG